MTVVSRLLGHSSTDITEKVYARLLPQTLTAEVEKLNYAFVPKELANLNINRSVWNTLKWIPDFGGNLHI